MSRRISNDAVMWFLVISLLSGMGAFIVGAAKQSTWIVIIGVIMTTLVVVAISLGPRDREG
jgi:hypothetical protein